MQFCQRCLMRQRQTLGAIAGIVTDDGERKEVLRHLVGDDHFGSAPQRD